jgi:hypothetical protein
MFQHLEITDQQRKEVDRWAESVIQKHKTTIASGQSYLLWSNELYYQREKDVWTDESWWIEIAKQRFLKLDVQVFENRLGVQY